MLNGVTTVYLSKDGEDGKAKIFGDVDVNFSGKDINDGCYVSELRTDLYERKFKLTCDELKSIETMAKELVASKKYSAVTVDLVKKTISKY